MNEIHAVLAIAQRDLLKFLRDPLRIASTFLFPVLFVVFLGGTLAGALDEDFDLRTFIFLGVFGQTMFQSAAMGIVSLIEDRENDFSQEIFVAPISRYTIVLGKIIGESLVALAQGAAIVVFGLAIGVKISAGQLAALTPAAAAVCLFGGAFGLLIMSNLQSQRAANQVFPYIMLPQFFLAGVFAPLGNLAAYLAWPSLLAPMRYPVDLLRGLYYPAEAQGTLAVALSPQRNFLVMAAAFAVFLSVGTALFIRREHNR